MRQENVSSRSFPMWISSSVLRKQQGLPSSRQGDAKEIMKSFTKDYPISIVASTQRIVHSPKVHTFGSIIYDARSDKYYEEEPYHNIEVVDRIGSGDAYVSGRSVRAALRLRKLSEGAGDRKCETKRGKEYHTGRSAFIRSQRDRERDPGA